MNIRVLVCGGRDFYDRKIVDDALSAIQPISVLIEGGATGADQIAHNWAKSRGIHVATVDALWDHYGKAAGPKRNEAMLRLMPDCVVAFPGGKGTKDMVMRAEGYGIPVHRVGWT